MSMIELTNTHQRKDERFIYFIHHWRNIILNCKDRLNEAFTIEMRIQGIQYELLYILQGINPKSVKDFSIHAYDMGLSMYSTKKEVVPLHVSRKAKEK